MRFSGGGCVCVWGGVLEEGLFSNRGRLKMFCWTSLSWNNRALIILGFMALELSTLPICTQANYVLTWDGQIWRTRLRVKVKLLAGLQFAKTSATATHSYGLRMSVSNHLKGTFYLTALSVLLTSSTIQWSSSPYSSFILLSPACIQFSPCNPSSSPSSSSPDRTVQTPASALGKPSSYSWLLSIVMWCLLFENQQAPQTNDQTNNNFVYNVLLSMPPQILITCIVTVK